MDSQNTIGRLLDRSQTIKQIFEKKIKTQRSHGPQGPWTMGPGPRGLGPKNHENHLFLRTWKRCASKFCEGNTDLELQIIDMEFLGANSVFEKVRKSVKID